MHLSNLVLKSVAEEQDYGRKTNELGVTYPLLENESRSSMNSRAHTDCA